MLNLKDAYARIERARKHQGELAQSFHEWTTSGGIQLIGERDPEFARYSWGVSMTAEPNENLALLAGEIFNNLRSALDYVAFQIYLTGGGDATAKQAKAVAFPIVTEEEKWKKVVIANVPNAWGEAIEKLTWCQPFVQIGPQSNVLPALRGVGATDKHHNLVLYAMGVFGIGGIGPELGEDKSMIMMMAQPGPEVKLNEPGLIGMVYVRESNSPEYPNEALIPWSSGFQLEAPPPPNAQFGFRASDGSSVSLDAIPELISYVEAVVNRFAKLQTPAVPPTPAPI